MKRFLVVTFSVLAIWLFCLQVPINSQYSSMMTDTHLQNIDAKLKHLSRIHQRDATFQLYSTQNHYTFLMLDARDGRVWQLHWSTKEDGYEGTSPINAKPLVPTNDKNKGRFTLYPTANFWNYILLDQHTGSSWACQFSVDKPELRFIKRLSGPKHY